MFFKTFGFADLDFVPKNGFIGDSSDFNERLRFPKRYLEAIFFFLRTSAKESFAIFDRSFSPFDQFPPPALSGFIFLLFARILDEVFLVAEFVSADMQRKSEPVADIFDEINVRLFLGSFDIVWMVFNGKNYQLKINTSIL